MNAGEIWVLKVPTDIDATFLAPIIVDCQDYTACKETESCYGGMYPKCYEVINYYVPKPHGYLIVPYTGKRADYRYGFHEFDTKSAMTIWLQNNREKAGAILDSNPEYFI